MHSETTPSGAPAPREPFMPDSEALAAELDQLRATVLALKEESLRERAELDNQRKRLVRDLDQARRLANERLLTDLLPVLDSLEAGLAAAADADTGKLREGMELTLRQLLKVAGENGLSVINPIGQAFDPEQHQAISETAAADVAPGSVAQVFQKGYRLNERLLRPALVVIAKDAD